MPLRRSPNHTPEFLAAQRSNALKSTGPRTPKGKAGVRLNALKHGERSVRFARYLAGFGRASLVLSSLLRIGRLPTETVGRGQLLMLRRWLDAECGPESRVLERLERRLAQEQEQAERKQAEALVTIWVRSHGYSTELTPELVPMWDALVENMRRRMYGGQPPKWAPKLAAKWDRPQTKPECDLLSTNIDRAR